MALYQLSEASYVTMLAQLRVSISYNVMWKPFLLDNMCWYVCGCCCCTCDYTLWACPEGKKKNNWKKYAIMKVQEFIFLVAL